MSISVIPVSAAVVKRGDRFLLAQRLSGKHLGDLWEFPGGKVEPGETPEAALERELAEELDIATRTGRILDAKLAGDYLVLFYESLYVGGELRLKEAQDARFVTLSEARALPLTESDRAALERLAQLGALA